MNKNEQIKVRSKDNSFDYSDNIEHDKLISLFESIENDDADFLFPKEKNKKFSPMKKTPISIAVKPRNKKEEKKKEKFVESSSKEDSFEKFINRKFTEKKHRENEISGVENFMNFILFVSKIAAFLAFIYFVCFSSNDKIDDVFREKNICSIKNAKIKGISLLYRYGMFKSKKTSVENFMVEGNSCTSLESLKNAFVAVEFDRSYLVQKVALFHPIQGNPKSAIKEFTIEYQPENKTELVRKTCIYKASRGYQEYSINETIKDFKIRIKSNYGAPYISIYRLYVFGY
ncbi:hypothetical protein NUSPORA_00951 [Nucleospora cyclopteri]